MRKILAGLSALLFLSVNAPAAVPVQYSYSGVGFHLGFDVLNNVINDIAAAFDAGAQGDIAFSLGPAGEAHYCPSVGMWFGGNEVNNHHYFAMEWYFNFGDARYYFPMPATVKARPFVGLGPMIGIDYQKETNNAVTPSQVYESTNSTMGFNALAGADFRLLPGIIFTAEMRGKVGDWYAFKFSGGMTFVVNNR
jgi:hypothetical protein